MTRRCPQVSANCKLLGMYARNSNRPASGVGDQDGHVGRAESADGLRAQAGADRAGSLRWTPASSGGCTMSYYTYQWSADNGTTWNDSWRLTGASPRAASRGHMGRLTQYSCACKSARTTSLDSGPTPRARPRSSVCRRRCRPRHPHRVAVSSLGLGRDEPHVAQPNTNGLPDRPVPGAVCNGYPACRSPRRTGRRADHEHGVALVAHPYCRGVSELLHAAHPPHTTASVTACGGTSSCRRCWPYQVAATTGTAPHTTNLTWCPRHSGAIAQGHYKVYVCTAGTCASDSDWHDTGLNTAETPTVTHECGWALLCRVPASRSCSRRRPITSHTEQHRAAGSRRPTPRANRALRRTSPPRRVP